MYKVKDVFDAMNAAAPVEYSLPTDNVGLLVGDGETAVRKVIVALDITMKVIDEAVDAGAELIVAHHPMPKTPLTRMAAGEADADKIIKLIRHGISTISMHTNLDAAEGGVNDMLARAVGMKSPDRFETYQAKPGQPTIGRVGYIEPECSLDEFLARVKSALAPAGMRYIVGSGRVHRIAVGSGNCSDFWRAAIEAGCDTYLSADFKYGMLLTAAETGRINIIDGGHFPTENVVCPRIAEIINKSCPGLDVRISSVHGDVIKFYI